MKSLLLLTIHFLIFILLSTYPTLTAALDLFNPLSDPPRPTIISTFATRSGSVPLHRDEFGFYALVDIASHRTDASDDIPSPDTIPVQLGLHTSKSLLAGGCLGFSNYTCGPQICNSFPWTDSNFTFLQFSAQGYEASLLLYLDYNNWYLQNYALITNSCVTNAGSTFGSKRYGIIGLGVAADSAYNFIGTRTFSITIDPHLWKGQLAFRDNNNKIWINGTKHNVTCDQNWLMNANETDKIIIKNSSISTVLARGIFDLDSDTMGFPQTLYPKLIALFENETSTKCTDDLIKPNCTYIGNISMLPNVTLQLEGNKINIPPKIYVRNGSNITTNVTSVVLNFKAIGTNLTGDNYISKYYENAIIFDMNIASFYFVLFNTTKDNQNKITFIEGKWDQPGSPPPTKAWTYVLFGSIGFLVLCAIIGCVYFIKKKRDLKRKRYAKVVQKDSVQPLLVNQQDS